MATANMPPIEFLRECFSYNPETGEFRWRHRPDSHFTSEDRARSWNERYAGTQAFYGADDKGYMRATVTYNDRRVFLKANRVGFAITHGWWPDNVDHQNRKQAVNNIGNLRPATFGQNNANRSAWSEVGLKGVTQYGDKFKAFARADGKTQYLGTFATAEQAHAAYCSFAKHRHGEFFCSARLDDHFKPTKPPVLPDSK